MSEILSFYYVTLLTGSEQDAQQPEKTSVETPVDGEDLEIDSDSEAIRKDPSIYFSRVCFRTADHAAKQAERMMHWLSIGGVNALKVKRFDGTARMGISLDKVEQIKLEAIKGVSLTRVMEIIELDLEKPTHSSIWSLETLRALSEISGVQFTEGQKIE